MRVVIRDDAESLSHFTAAYIAAKINHFSKTGKMFNIICPCGKSPFQVYKMLSKMCSEGRVSFANVRIFQMDEFYGLPKDSDKTQRNQLYETLLKNVDLKPENIYMFDAWVPFGELDKECERYEEEIERLGGIDFSFFGTGADGHLARNEPGSSLQSSSRKTFLAHDTRLTLSERWGMDLEEIPKFTVTVGTKTLFEARDVLVIFSGVSRAHSLEMCLEHGVNHMFPVSVFQSHKSCIFVCDEDSTNELRVKTVHYFKSIAETAKIAFDN